MKKAALVGFVSFLLASLLAGQSLVDASKQEKERREKLKGQNARVVTNADLRPKAKDSTASARAQESVKPKTPAPSTQPAPEAGVPAETEAQAERPETEAAPIYATEVSPDTSATANPDLATGPPDNRFAEISVTGSLEMAFAAHDGPGDDIAIYARRPDLKVPEAEKENQLEVPEAAMLWGDFRYAVLALDSRGEWQEIGLGSGNYPDRFDLAGLPSISRIRIMFKPYASPYNVGVNPLRQASGELTFGVDAVEALH